MVRFDVAELDAIARTGNKASNRIFLAEITVDDMNRFSLIRLSKDLLREFVRLKYVERRWYRIPPFSPIQSRVPSSIPPPRLENPPPLTASVPPLAPVLASAHVPAPAPIPVLPKAPPRPPPSTSQSTSGGRVAPPVASFSPGAIQLTQPTRQNAASTCTPTSPSIQMNDSPSTPVIAFPLHDSEVAINLTAPSVRVEPVPFYSEAPLSIPAVDGVVDHSLETVYAYAVGSDPTARRAARVSSNFLRRHPYPHAPAALVVESPGSVEGEVGLPDVVEIPDPTVLRPILLGPARRSTVTSPSSSISSSALSLSPVTAIVQNTGQSFSGNHTQPVAYGSSTPQRMQPSIPPTPDLLILTSYDQPDFLTS